ncbi:MAG: MFS transporter [Trebonia sp.]
MRTATPTSWRTPATASRSLTWVINAFLVTFGSFLLLAGRLGDLAGRKRVLLAGLTVFTVASLLCGIADSSGLLIGARFLQGVGAAMQASVILAIIVTEFPEPQERAKAMSAWVFASVAGGSLGLCSAARSRSCSIGTGSSS